MELCPDGWYLPSDDDWKILESHLGMNNSELDADPPSSADRTTGSVGKQIKTSHEWFFNLNGTNSSGFNAHPAGVIGVPGLSSYNGGANIATFYWTSSLFMLDSMAIIRGLMYTSDGVARSILPVRIGASIRCLKGTAPNNPPLIETSSAFSTGWDIGEAEGKIIAIGDYPISEFGFCFSENQNPTINDSKLTGTMTSIEDFECIISGLGAGKTYYIKAFANNSNNQTGYGEEKSFTTDDGKPTVLTSAGTAQPYAISIGGNISDEGPMPVIERGVCWSTSQNPVYADNHTNDGSGGGVFSSMLSGLQPSTKYYIRAFANNGIATGYGQQEEVSTKSATPSLSTSPATVTGSNSFLCGGNIANNGGSAITEKGVVYSKTGTPDINGPKKTSPGSALGDFLVGVEGLDSGSSYTVRAYATNANGFTGYGQTRTVILN